ncbi:MAG: sialate O-acetylesterase [Planctomycetota bacterium]|jgi:sialate O-acetylesterase|nr:sialate O-acetylesterase [Planctomycetota bacterium]
MLALLLILSSAPQDPAELALPKIFGDHMVLQSEKPVRLWGWAKAEEEVTVTFAGQTEKTRAKNGRWSIQLNSMAASFEPRELMVRASSGVITLRDVLVGEVWVCGGQSNMEWTLRSSRDADLEMMSADSPAIRFIRLPKIARAEPQEDFPVKSDTSPEGNWRRCIPEQVENCTAVGYYFARRLHRRLKRPVGLIDTSWGGTMAQHWVTKETLAPIAAMKPYLERYQQDLRTWIDGGREAGAEQRHKADLKAWEVERDKAQNEGRRVPGKPSPNRYTDPASKGQPGGMMNGVIRPIDKMTLRGVIFYQGENNSFTVGWKPFPETFPAVISDWRRVFGEADLPFGIIQIAGWSNRRSMTYDMNHHCNIIREIQFNTWKHTPDTGLIATYDTNSNGSIHPGRKLPVGERTARWALAEVYRVKAYRSNDAPEWRGPVYRGHEVVKNKVVITFEDGTNRGLRLDQDVDVGFYIAGKDAVFHTARARVRGKDNSIEVWNDAVPAPIAVRYAWSNLPAGGLMNARELPAYPFRTDTWPMTPHQSTGSYEVGK